MTLAELEKLRGAGYVSPAGVCGGAAWPLDGGCEEDARARGARRLGRVRLGL